MDILDAKLGRPKTFDELVHEGIAEEIGIGPDENGNFYHCIRMKNSGAVMEEQIYENGGYHA